MPFELFAPHLRPSLYLDPGSGSFLIQLLLAALLGGAFAVKIYWKKIMAFVTGKKDDSPRPSDEEIPAPTVSEATEGETPVDPIKSNTNGK